MKLENSFIPFAKGAIEQSIPSRFEKQVSLYPDQPAIISHHGSVLTYHQLNRLANRIAMRILHCAKSEPIAILIDQGPMLIAAILGVLKSGNFYVPFDATHPEARNHYLLNHSGAQWVVTQTKNVDHALALSPGRGIIDIDELTDDGSDENLSISIAPDANAYIFYTSGSTGRPKGVHDSHRNVLHNIMRYTNNLHFCAQDRMTLLQSPTFSGTVSSLLGALLNGGSICPYDLIKDGLGNSLAEWINAMRITFYHSVPAIFRSFLVGERSFPTVRLIRLEGDTASTVDVELYKRYFEPACLLVNGLGATETGISRQFFIEKRTQLESSIVPIGYATEDMNATIVDDRGQPVKPNEIGELVVQSRFLSIGYWKDATLTEKSFRPRSFGERAYHTGDLCRMRSDGCLEYLGRKDFGFKVRGHRIEPAEIESALLDIEGIVDVVVVTREAKPGNPRLFAYIVPLEGRTLQIGQIRSELRRTLPGHMIPNVFLFLDSLPLNENGKVDRRLLRASHTVQRQRRSKVEPARDEFERDLVALWEKILEVQPIGIHDDFFELGGDSLMATELMTSLERSTGQRMPLAILLKAPTIAQLSDVRIQLLEIDESPVVKLQAEGANSPIFLVHPHNGNAICFLAIAKSFGTTQPCYGLQSSSLSRSHSIPLRVETMAAAYTDEIKKVQPTGPYFLGGSCFGGYIAIEMARLLAARGDEIGLVMLLDSNPADFRGLAPRETCKKIRQDQNTRLVQQHVSAMKLISHKEQLIYIGSRVLRKLRFASWVVAANLLETFGVGLPNFMQDVEKINRFASYVYRPKKYEGRLTIFLSGLQASRYSKNPREDWGDVAAEYDIHFIAGNGRSVLEEPDVDQVAKIIQTLIEH